MIAHDKFSYSPRQRIMNPKKIYLLDTDFSLLSMDFSENRGKLLENAVAIEEGFILTNDEEKEQTFDGAKVRIMPVWKWLRK